MAPQAAFNLQVWPGNKLENLTPGRPGPDLAFAMMGTGGPHLPVQDLTGGRPRRYDGSPLRLATATFFGKHSGFC
jgi:hypothetical protein